MRVISQEGFCYQDIPYEHSAFYMSTSGNHIYANCNGIVYSLAEYTTAKKAEKAMEMLHSYYGDYMIEKVYKQEIRSMWPVFQFPAEDEL